VLREGFMASHEKWIEPGALVLMTGLSWLVMLIIGSMTWVTLVGRRGQHAPDEPLVELALLFPIVMAIPFAFVLGAVHLPAVLLARSLTNGRSVWLSIVGGLAGPLAAVVLLLAGRILFGGSLTGILASIARDPVSVTPWLLALVAGGIVLGLGIARTDQPNPRAA
jgi:hypothetical protein